MVKTADWIIDMGPEGGSGGGLVVCEGTPEQVAEHPTSHTGRFLKPLLEVGAKVGARPADAPIPGESSKMTQTSLLVDRGPSREEVEANRAKNKERADAKAKAEKAAARALKKADAASLAMFADAPAAPKMTAAKKTAAKTVPATSGAKKSK